MTITFIVLTNAAGTAQLTRDFLAAGSALGLDFTGKDQLQAQSCTIAAADQEQLLAGFEQEHGYSLADECPDFEPVEFVFSIPSYQGSKNELAMSLSRVLTPPAKLPPEAAAREQDYLLETPARFPWMVFVR